MSKKKVEVSLDRSPMRDAPLTGDIEINYAGETIYATSETTEVHILTENTVCLHDIIVGYDKPEEPIIGVPVTINNTSSTPTDEMEIYLAACVISDGVVVQGDARYDDDLRIIPMRENGEYFLEFEIRSLSDAYDITVSIGTCEYEQDDSRYYWTWHGVALPNTLTITITDKSNDR